MIDTGRGSAHRSVTRTSSISPARRRGPSSRPWSKPMRPACSVSTASLSSACGPDAMPSGRRPHRARCQDGLRPQLLEVTAQEILIDDRVGIRSDR